MEVYQGMKKYGLAFSAGKDSMACLFLLLDQGLLDEATVIWVNPGKNYPELLDTVAKAKALCKNFVEVKTDRDAQNLIEGIPSDVVPINFTRFGMEATGKKSSSVIQSYIGCCYHNISGPLHAKAKELAITHLVRGQRLDESHKSPARDGMEVDGVVYLQPIETWTRDQVMEYLRTKMEIPEHYSLDHSSMDCYDCTAFLTESNDRVEFMKEKYPKFHAEYSARLETIKSALRESVEVLYG
jgi:phosphoadenosine phosphosulfate reductase